MVKTAFKPKFLFQGASLKRFIVYSLVFLLVFSYAPTVHMGNVENEGLLNPSFESGNPPSNWTVYSGTWGTQLNKSTAHKLDSSYSLQINDNSSSNGYGMRSAKIAATAYATYVATIGAYAESGVGQLYLEFWDANNNRIGTSIASTGSTGKWVLLRTQAQAPAGTRYVTMLLYGHNSNVGICYYDAGRIHKVDEVPDFQNPGFEGAVDSNGEPEGWNVYSGTMGTDLVISTEQAYEGAKGLKIIDGSTTANKGLRSVPIAAAAGSKYEASAWIYNVSGAGEIYLEFWQSSVNNTADTRLGTVIGSSSGTGAWQKITVNGTAPAGTEYMTVLLYSSIPNSGTSYFDLANARQFYDAPPVDFTSQVAGHPRLFFTASELTALKAKKDDTNVNKYDSSFAEQWSKIQATAESYLTETSLTNNLTTYGSIVTYSLPPVQPDPIENPPGFNTGRYPYWTWLGSSLLSRLETLSYAYAITDDVRYGNKAKEYALALADWSTWSDPTYDTGLSCLDSSYLTRGVSEVYDMCYDLLTTAERNKLSQAIYEKGIRPLYKETETKVDQNIFMVRSSALATAAAVELGERDSCDAYMYRAYDYWNWYLDLRSGSNDTEAFLYTSLSIDYLYQGADFVKRVTGNDAPFSHPYAGTLSRWLVDFLSPTGAGLVDFSDSSRDVYFGTTMCILSSRNDGLAGWYVKESKLSKKGGLAAFNYLSANGALTSPEEAGLPTMSGANANIGYASMRTGWGVDDQLLALYSGPSDLGHNHTDDNSFVYNVAGEWLLADPGYMNLSTPAKQTFTQQTIGHNAMMINGSGQTLKSGGLIAGLFSSPVFDLCIGDATGSYATSPDVSSWKRRVIFIKPDYFIIQDYVTLTGSGTPEVLLHGDAGAVFTSGGSPLTLGGSLPANFVIQKPRASVSIQSLRPTSATRLYTQYTGAEMYGTYGSIKPSSAVSSESFVTLMMPKVHKQGIIEGETLLPVASSGGGASSDTLISGNRVAYYTGTGQSGDYVTFNFNVPTAGTYNLKVGLMKQSYGPIVNVKLDGTLLQSGVNTYADSGQLELSFNNRTLTAGNHSIRFDITGKDPNGYGYTLDLDYLRLLATDQTVETAQPYSVNTAADGSVTGLVVTVDASTSDQILLNPANTATYTTSNLTLTCKGTQGMARKTSSGVYKRYAVVNTLTTGANMTDGSQTLAQDLGANSAIGIGEDSSGKWTGMLRMGTAGTPKFYVPSVTQVKLDGTVLSTSQYSYSSSTKLLTINSVAAGDHTLEITP